MAGHSILVPIIKGFMIGEKVLTQEVAERSYSGSGTTDDPFLVEWFPGDEANPYNFSPARRWNITTLTALSCLAVAFSSSAYAGGIPSLRAEFEISDQFSLLGVSLFVLGFAVGPFAWAPLSEVYGRRLIFICTYSALTIFDAGCIAVQNPSQLIILRFFCGLVGSSTITNSGAVIADIFMAKDRGLAMSMFAVAPFMGPVLGPIAGGFLGEKAGWRWVLALIAILTALLCVLCSIFIPETYGPILLQRRAEALEKATGMVYTTPMVKENGKKTVTATLKVSLLRPWKLLILEPIVLILSIYMAIMYGTVYMFFAAFPIVFRQSRGWSQGISGLAFIGMAVGMAGALVYMYFENGRYTRITAKLPGGVAPPETRLRVAMIAAIVTPIGLFWFAWTNGPGIHWIVCIFSTVLFGFGNVLLTLGCMNYLVDAYVIYAASALAASTLFRSLLGAIFPLFTGKMYEELGFHWASSIPAFLTLACVPFPFVLTNYGLAIRKHCKFAAEAEAIREIMTR